MQERILQLNFRVNIAGDQYQAAVSPLADSFAAVPGLRWKIWYVKNEQTGDAGGIYLFDNQMSLDRFASSDLVKQVMSHPALTDFSVKQFDILERESLTTRAPLGAKVGA
jgi:hypothetical protein